MTKGNSVSTNEDIEATINFLSKIKNRQLEITIFGGEPTIDTRLATVAQRLREFADVIVFTNLSGNIELYKNLLDIGCRINASYHGIITKQQSFLEKLNALYLYNENAFHYINILLHDDVNQILDFCKEHTINHRLSPIIGVSKKSDWVACISYNASLNQKYYDTTIITDDMKRRKLIDSECMFLNFNNFKNYICYAGHSYIFIDHKGLIYRCVNDYDNNKPYSSVLEPFTPSEITCTYDICNCEFFVPKERKYNCCNNYIESI